MTRKLILSVAAIGAMTAASSPALALSASFNWCSGTPAFRIGGVPKGTVKLDFQMTDLNVPSYLHGGGSVAYTGQASIPCGGLSGGYNGPSPPGGEVHTYRWTVKALDASGKVLGQTTTENKFPQK